MTAPNALEDITYTPCTRAPRFPAGPLLRAAAAHNRLPLCSQAMAAERDTNCAGCRDGLHYGLRTLARDAGVSEDLPRLWCIRGMSEKMADLVACRLGLHPAMVWGPTWWEIEGDLVAAMEDRLERKYADAAAARAAAGQAALFELSEVG